MGFGRINAKDAVDVARSWTLVDEEKSFKGRSFPTQKTVIPISKNLNTEFVEVYFKSDHVPWGDLEVTLTSPYGATSVLAEPHSVKHWGVWSDSSTYNDWRFGTVRHFGESSQGDWTLEVEGGDFDYWAIKIYGTALPTWTLTTPTACTCEQEESGGVVCTFSDGSGSVLLQPTKVARTDLRYVFLNADDAESATHSGTYWFPRQ